MHNTRAKGTTAAVQLALACCCLGMLLPRHMAGPSMLQTMEIHVRIRIGIPTYTCDYVHVKNIRALLCIRIRMYTTCKNVQTRLGALPANWQTHAGDKPCNGACMQRGKTMRIKEYPYWPCIVHARRDSNNKQISAEVAMRASARTRHAHAHTHSTAHGATRIAND